MTVTEVARAKVTRIQALIDDGWERETACRKVRMCPGHFYQVRRAIRRREAKGRFVVGQLVAFSEDGLTLNQSIVEKIYLDGMPSCREPMLKLRGIHGLILMGKCNLVL